MRQSNVTSGALVVVLGFGISLGCAQVGREEPEMGLAGCSKHLLHHADVPDTLILAACTLRDQYQSHGSIDVAILAYNAGQSSTDTGVVLRPNFRLGVDLMATVVSPHGDTVRQVDHMDPVMEQEGAIVLHRGDFVGRVLDLACPERYPDGECVTVYPLTDAGSYRLRFVLEKPCGVLGCPGDRPSPSRLVSNAVDVHIGE